MFDLISCVFVYVTLRCRAAHRELVEGGIEPGTTIICHNNLPHVELQSKSVNHEVVVERYKAEMAAGDLKFIIEYMWMKKIFV